MEIIPTERSIYYGLELNGEIRHTGETPVGAMTATPLAAHMDDDESAFLEKMRPFAAQFPPLPASADHIETGRLYRHQGGVVRGEGRGR